MAVNPGGVWSEKYQRVQAANKDYSPGYYERGHLNPFSYQCDDARKATMTLTNAVPQDPCFNKDAWAVYEKQAKQVVNSMCTGPGFKRFFVTGAHAQSGDLSIPLEDTLDDRRILNRVKVPSFLWTAFCCEPPPGKTNEGFSFAYHGDNNHDNGNFVFVTSVGELNTKLSRLIGGPVKIFQDTAVNGRRITNCVYSVEKSKQARTKIVAKEGCGNILNAANLLKGIRNFGRKRSRLNEEGEISNSFLDAVELQELYDACEAGMPLYTSNKLRLEEAEIPATIEGPVSDSMRSWMSRKHLGCFQTAPGLPLLFSSSSRKKQSTSNEAVCLIAEKRPNHLTASSQRCREDHYCGNHGENYRWCYTSYSNHWDYCCDPQTDCQPSSNYNFCYSGNTWAYCSPRVGTLTISGWSCRPGDECRLDDKGRGYFWCYVDYTNKWDYCCNLDGCRQGKCYVYHTSFHTFERHRSCTNTPSPPLRKKTELRKRSLRTNYNGGELLTSWNAIGPGFMYRQMSKKASWISANETCTNENAYLPILFQVSELEILSHWLNMQNIEEIWIAQANVSNPALVQKSCREVNDCASCYLLQKDGVNSSYIVKKMPCTEEVSTVCQIRPDIPQEEVPYFRDQRKIDCQMVETSYGYIEKGIVKNCFKMNNFVIWKLELLHGLSHAEADQSCGRVFGAHLASVHNEEEDLIISSACAVSGWSNGSDTDRDRFYGCWIGGYGSDSTFQWMDNTPFDYEGWAPDEPVQPRSGTYYTEMIFRGKKYYGWKAESGIGKHAICMLRYRIPPTPAPWTQSFTLKEGYRLFGYYYQSVQTTPAQCGLSCSNQTACKASTWSDSQHMVHAVFNCFYFGAMYTEKAEVGFTSYIRNPAL